MTPETRLRRIARRQRKRLVVRQRYYALVDELVDEIDAGREEGLTYRQIAEVMGIKHQSLPQLRRESYARRAKAAAASGSAQPEAAPSPA